MAELSARDRAILEFERLRWGHQGTKDDAVRTMFGMSWPRYVQVVHHIIDLPEAEAYDPTTVRRLRRLRDARRRDRSGKSLGYKNGWPT